MERFRRPSQVGRATPSPGIRAKPKQTVLLPRPPQVQELVGPLITMSRLRRKPATRY
jgi:hypothetical protein